MKTAMNLQTIMTAEITRIEVFMEDWVTEAQAGEGKGIEQSQRMCSLGQSQGRRRRARSMMTMTFTCTLGMRSTAAAGV